MMMLSSKVLQYNIYLCMCVCVTIRYLREYYVGELVDNEMPVYADTRY